MDKIGILLWLGFAGYAWICYYLVADLYGF